MHAARTCGKMHDVKPHSKAVCLLAPQCAHMVTARFGQSDRPRLNRLRIRRRRKKALALCENTGKFSQKHSAKCVKNARRRTTEKLQVASSAPLYLLATFQGERCARYARRTQKILKIRYAPLYSKRKQAQNYAYSEDN